jgi:hypothetical protein
MIAKQSQAAKKFAPLWCEPIKLCVPKILAGLKVNIHKKATMFPKFSNFYIRIMLRSQCLNVYNRFGRFREPPVEGLLFENYRNVEGANESLPFFFFVGHTATLVFVMSNTDAACDSVSNHELPPLARSATDTQAKIFLVHIQTIVEIQ